MSEVHQLAIILLLLAVPAAAMLLVLLPDHPGPGWLFWLSGAACAAYWWVSWFGDHPSTDEERIIAESSNLITAGLAAMATWPVVVSLLVWLRRRLSGNGQKPSTARQMAVLVAGVAPAGLVLVLIVLGM